MVIKKGIHTHRHTHSTHPHTGTHTERNTLVVSFNTLCVYINFRANWNLNNYYQADKKCFFFFYLISVASSGSFNEQRHGRYASKRDTNSMFNS